MVKLFGLDNCETRLYEDFETFTLSAKSSVIAIPDLEKFGSTFLKVSQDGTCIIKITFNENDPLDVSSNNKSSFKTFLGDVKNSLIALGEDILTVEFNLKILKERGGNKINVYNFFSFSNYLKSTEIYFLLNRFNDLLNEKGNLLFNIIGTNIETFGSQSISFGHAQNVFDHNSKRKKLLNLKQEICHFSESSLFQLLPSDFFLTKKSEDEDLNTLFDRLSTILSMIFIFDITSFSDKKYLDYKLIGYRSFNGSIELSKIDTLSVLHYYKIYEWIYNADNTSDRIGLARNIISLNLTKDVLSITDSTYLSILSAFEIYLKKNIEQYIAVKNKVSESILDLSKRANGVVEELGNSFKNNIILFVTYFLSIIVFNTINGNHFINLFTRDISLISWMLVLISFCYCFYSVWEISHNKNRYEQIYFSLKSRYEDILDKNDLNKIFEDDKPLFNDIKYIDRKSLALSILWTFTLLTIFFVVWHLKVEG